MDWPSDWLTTQSMRLRDRSLSRCRHSSPQHVDTSVIVITLMNRLVDWLMYWSTDCKCCLVVAPGGDLSAALSYVGDCQHTAGLQWLTWPGDCLLWNKEGNRPSCHVKCYDCWRPCAPRRHSSGQARNGAEGVCIGSFLPLPLAAGREATNNLPALRPQHGPSALPNRP